MSMLILPGYSFWRSVGSETCDLINQPHRDVICNTSPQQLQEAEPQPSVSAPRGSTLDDMMVSRIEMIIARKILKIRSPGPHPYPSASCDFKASAPDVSQHDPVHDHIFDSIRGCYARICTFLPQLCATDRD